MGRIARRKAAERAAADAREASAAAYVTEVLNGREPPSAPSWMAPVLAAWVAHATAETLSPGDPAGGMERARRLIAAMTEGK